ncbi:hypothetical protein Q763_15345 [Flavobacterium beibuense F44-8]|uniref:DUF4252 domain-containing protein n=2 Tax=Flavobacterium beibuense TaxID=657326 RepID=A0A0A2LSA4_9FLAO|nr:hypothetical protein Q763_15345 [Flavobacterium beibuense F44-8]
MNHQEKQSLKSKKMKKLIVTLIVMLVPVLFYAQGAFDKFNDIDDVAVIVVDKSMVDLAKEMKVGKSEQDMVTKFTEGLDNLKVYSTEVKKYKKQLKAAVKDYLRDNNMKTLISVKDDGEEVKVYAKQTSSDTLDEVLVFVDGGDGDETLVVTFTGKVKL